jgi:hypothetical protein
LISEVLVQKMLILSTWHSWYVFSYNLPNNFSKSISDIVFFYFLQFEVFYCYYPKRLSQVLFVDAPFMFKQFWRLVKPMLKSYASQVSVTCIKCSHIFNIRKKKRYSYIFACVILDIGFC